MAKNTWTRNIINIIIALLFCISDLGAMEVEQGKRLWIKDASRLTFFKDCGLSEFSPEKLEAFTIQKELPPNSSDHIYVEVKFDTGQVACIDKDKIDTYHAEEWFHFKDIKESNEAYKALKNKKIGKNSYVWLKHPINTKEIPGLSKVQIKSIDIHEDYVKVVFYEDGDLFLQDEEDVEDSFYLKDPSKLFSKKAKKAISEMRIYIGMSKKETLASWGKPTHINRSAGRWGTHEQWVYGSNYLYFENGILTSWQD